MMKKVVKTRNMYRKNRLIGVNLVLKELLIEYLVKKRSKMKMKKMKMKKI